MENIQNDTGARILIVDDDENIGNLLEEALRGKGYRPIRAYSGTEALMILDRERPDLILLDLMLPGLSGEEILPRISGIPVMIMSAKSDVDLKVKLLYDGACDYVTKPFVISELLARIAAVLRLYSGANDRKEPVNESEITANGVRLDCSLCVAYCGGEEIPLTRTETAILHILMLNAGRPMGKNTILDRIMDSTPDCTDRSLKQHISNIRKKLETADGMDHIKAVYGIGFRFV